MKRMMAGKKEEDDDEKGARRHEIECIEGGAEGGLTIAGFAQQDEGADEEEQQRDEGNRQPQLGLYGHLLLVGDFLGGGERAPHGNGRGCADQDGEETMPGRGAARQQIDRPQQEGDGAGKWTQEEPEGAAIEEATVGRLYEANRCGLQPGKGKGNALVGDDDESQPRKNEAAQQNET